MWYLNFCTSALTAERHYVAWHISVPRLEEADVKNEVAHAKYHSCKIKKKGEGGEESKASTVDLKILITANILAGKLISQNIYANKKSSSTTRASVI